MRLSSLHRDIVSIHKDNGEVIDNVRASVQKDKIFISRSDILIETGDLIQRVMSNGGIENYRVIDPGFHEGLGHAIPAGYQITHKNLGIPEVEKAIQKVTYNLNGNNTRVNNNSVDQSVNSVSINDEISEHILMLRDEVKRIVDDIDKQKESLEIIDAIEGQFASEKPSIPVLKTLVEALPSAGSISSIGSFLLSCIGG